MRGYRLSTEEWELLLSALHDKEASIEKATRTAAEEEDEEAVCAYHEQFQTLVIIHAKLAHLRPSFRKRREAAEVTT